MKSNLLRIAAVAIALTGVHTAQAVAIHDQMAVMTDGLPASTANQLNWINAIINYHNAPTAGTDPFTVTTAPANQGPETVDILNYSTSDSVFAAATSALKLESNLGGDLGAGYLYALAKYGGGQDRGPSVIYYLGGVALDIPNQAPTGQWGLSHVTLFNPGNSVPDGGTTAVLLGLGVLGLTMFRRKS